MGQNVTQMTLATSGLNHPLPAGTVVQTIPGGERRLESWSGTIFSAIAVTDGSWRYEVCPDESCWAKSQMRPWQTLRVYSYELNVIIEAGEA